MDSGCQRAQVDSTQALAPRPEVLSKVFAPTDAQARQYTELGSRSGVLNVRGELAMLCACLNRQFE
jgi:hypothetical protein